MIKEVFYMYKDVEFLYAEELYKMDKVKKFFQKLTDKQLICNVQWALLNWQGKESIRKLGKGCEWAIHRSISPNAQETWQAMLKPVSSERNSGSMVRFAGGLIAGKGAPISGRRMVPVAIVFPLWFYELYKFSREIVLTFRISNIFKGL